MSRRTISNFNQISGNQVSFNDLFLVTKKNIDNFKISSESLVSTIKNNIFGYSKMIFVDNNIIDDYNNFEKLKLNEIEDLYFSKYGFVKNYSNNNIPEDHDIKYDYFSGAVFTGKDSNWSINSETLNYSDYAISKSCDTTWVSSTNPGIINNNSTTRPWSILFEDLDFTNYKTTFIRYQTGIFDSSGNSPYTSNFNFEINWSDNYTNVSGNCSNWYNLKGNQRNASYFWPQKQFKNNLNGILSYNAFFTDGIDENSKILSSIAKVLQIKIDTVNKKLVSLPIYNQDTSNNKCSSVFINIKSVK